jgi:MFS family permease
VPCQAPGDYQPVYNRPVDRSRASSPEILKINAYWFGLSFLWNGLHQLILPAVLLNFVDYQRKNTTLGLLTFAGLLIAAIIQPISGSVSDRWRSSWGKRRPLILIGTLGDFIFLALLAWSGGLVWVAIGYIGLQITSNIAHGPLQALLPDRVPPAQLGMASGIKNLMDMAGLVAAMLILGRVFDAEARRLVLAMILIGFFLACGAIVTLLGIRERACNDTLNQGIVPGDAGESIPTDSNERRNTYTWLLASRFLFLFGVYGVQGFMQYYVRDVVNVENPVQFTANLLATIILALMVFAMLGGWLGDRIGHKRILYCASILGSLGSILLIWARSPITLLIYGSIFGSAIGLFLTSNWALANLLAPSAQAGKYLGLSNLATAGAGALSRLNGPIIDALNTTRPGIYLGYTFLFIIGAITILASIFILRRVEKRLPLFSKGGKGEDTLDVDGAGKVNAPFLRPK